jgi:hypothetical protein
MSTIPRIALAVRQPWAWAIIHAGKDVENRSWARWIRDWKFRGRVAILASLGMTQDEYADGAEFINGLAPGSCPLPHEMIRGAIIGHVEIVDNVWSSESRWFFGPGALVLRDPVPVLPVPASGKLGLFEWKPSDKPLPEPARWMLPKQDAML